MKGPFFARKTALFVLTGLILACAVRADTVFQAGPSQTALVELFTSEGCSSCPPAEEWMTELGRSPQLWKNFVPVAFHVDYWDYLGWKDTYASPQYTQRQREYLARWRSKSAYTPMIVTNGAESKEWYTKTSLSLEGKKDAGLLKIESKPDGRFEATYTPHNGLYLGRVFAYAAYLGCGIRSSVERGENQGRVLPHDFTALDLVKEEMSYEQGNLKASFRFDPRTGPKAPRHAIAVWVTRRDGEPLQAAGGYLD